MDIVSAHQERLRRWQSSQAKLRTAREALDAGHLDEALELYSQAHNLGDDNLLCHVRGHFGRARILLRQRKFRYAGVDGFFGIFAVIVSPVRLWRRRRGPGIPQTTLTGS
jgi:hypothetical protein